MTNEELDALTFSYALAIESDDDEMMIAHSARIPEMAREIRRLRAIEAAARALVEESPSVWQNDLRAALAKEPGK